MMYRYKVKHNPFRRLKMAFKSRKRTRGNIFLGIVTTILASLSFTAMSACAKALAPISSEEMTFFSLGRSVGAYFHSAPHAPDQRAVFYREI